MTGDGAVTAAELAALKAHLEDGPRGLVPGVLTDTAGPPREVAACLHVVRLRLAGRGSSPVIAVDGSAGIIPAADGLCYAGAAAVCSDGRALAAWFTVPLMDRPAIFAEWQALRLGLRLAGGCSVPVLVITDNQVVATEARKAATGVYNSFAVGAHDRQALGDIRSATAQGITVTIAWRPKLPADRVHKTAATTLGRAAHSLAWCARRLAADGISLAGERDWLTGIASDAPRRGEALRQKYLHRFEAAAPVD